MGTWHRGFPALSLSGWTQWLKGQGEMVPSSCQAQSLCLLWDFSTSPGAPEWQVWGSARTVTRTMVHQAGRCCWGCQSTTYFHKDCFHEKKKDESFSWETLSERSRGTHFLWKPAASLSWVKDVKRKLPIFSPWYCSWIIIHYWFFR